MDQRSPQKQPRPQYMSCDGHLYTGASKVSQHNQWSKIPTARGGSEPVRTAQTKLTGGLAAAAFSKKVKATSSEDTLSLPPKPLTKDDASAAAPPNSGASDVEILGRI